MRLPVVLSLILHVVAIAVASRLPDAAPTRASRAIEVDVQTPEKPKALPETPPEPPKAPPPVPEKVAMRARPERRDVIENRPKKDERDEPPANEIPPAPKAEPSGPPPAGPRTGPVDLTLHNLPTVPGGEGIVLPPGSGGVVGGVPGGIGPVRKEWKMRGDAGNPITGKVAEAKVDKYPLVSQGRDGFVYSGPQFKARIALDGTVSFDDKNIRDFNGTSGSFDLTDLFMKGKKQDPYRYEKEKFLAATAEKRAELQKRGRAEQMASSLAMLPSHLERVWADTRRTPKQRRELLFTLWKESSSSEEEIGRAGNQARAIIESFIRNRLPEGSDEAFTEEELSALNRTTKDRFAPYH